jgi:hypothetical protein
MYDFSNPGYNANTKYASQILWSGTKQVGFGIATDYNPRLSQWKDFYITCHFYPIGNIAGYFQKFVKPLPGTAVVVKTPEPAPSTYTKDPTSDCLVAFRKAALDQINYLRSLHFAPNVTASADLDSSAQAKVLLISSTGSFEKSTAGVGELTYGKVENGDLSVDTCICNIKFCYFKNLIIFCFFFKVIT